MDYEKFLLDLVKPLVLNPDDVVVEVNQAEEDLFLIKVLVNANDLGRIIGKKGRIANSIRTLAYACAARDNKRLEISIEEK